VPHPYRLLGVPGNLPRHVLEWLLAAHVHDLTVQLQVADIRALCALDMVEDLGAGKIAVKREIPRDATPQGISDQFDTQCGVVFEVLYRTALPLLPRSRRVLLCRSGWPPVPPLCVATRVRLGSGRFPDRFQECRVRSGPAPYDAQPLPPTNAFTTYDVLPTHQRATFSPAPSTHDVMSRL
jgi:hypothetical protein